MAEIERAVQRADSAAWIGVEKGPWQRVIGVEKEPSSL
jgi:hypothetical protein